MEIPFSFLILEEILSGSTTEYNDDNKLSYTGFITLRYDPSGHNIIIYFYNNFYNNLS